jgi:hypothetical protein
MSQSESDAVELKILKMKKTRKKVKKKEKLINILLLNNYDNYETAEQEIQNLKIKGLKISYKRFSQIGYQLLMCAKNFIHFVLW